MTKLPPSFPNMGEIRTIGIAISPRLEGALPATTRGMNKGIPASPGHTNGQELVKTTAAKAIQIAVFGQLKVAANNR